MFIALSCALQELHSKEIGLNFLVTGHSQNENDSAHAKVEVAAKICIVYSPLEWQTIIRNSLRKASQGDPVVSIDNTFIVNFKSKKHFPQYSDLFSRKTLFVNIAGEKEEIKWSKLMQLRFLGSETQMFYFKNITQILNSVKCSLCITKEEKVRGI